MDTAPQRRGRWRRWATISSNTRWAKVRLAKSNPATWIPIFEQNRDNVLDVLDEHIAVLSQFRSLLIKRNFDDFRTMIDKANDIKRILK